MSGKQVRSFISMLSLVAVGSVALAAHASSVSNARLIAIQVSGTSSAVLTVDVAVPGRPACHLPLAESDYSFDITTNKGKAMLQLAQGAFLGNKKIQIIGGTTCFGGLEAVQTLRVSAQ